MYLRNAGTIATGDASSSSHFWICSRAVSICGPASKPNTARRMTSRVMSWNSSWSSNGSPAARRRSGARPLVDQVAVALHPLAVEGGQHELALAQVGRAVEQEDRGGSEDGLEQVEPASGAGAQGIAIAGGDRLDRAGVGHEDVGRPAAAVDPQGEDVAEALAALAQQRGRAQRPAEAL